RGRRRRVLVPLADDVALADDQYAAAALDVRVVLPRLVELVPIDAGLLENFLLLRRARLALVRQQRAPAALALRRREVVRQLRLAGLLAAGGRQRRHEQRQAHGREPHGSSHRGLSLWMGFRRQAGRITGARARRKSSYRRSACP